MISLAFSIVVSALAPAPKQSAPEEFTTRQARGVTLNYSVQMSAQDADALLGSLTSTKDVLRGGLGIELAVEPIVQVRRRKGARKAYYTDGEDRVFLDFPSEVYFVRLQFSDERILRYSVPAFLQLWLSRCLSSTAGLDPRILDSLTDYAMYLVHVQQAGATKGAQPPPPPTGHGQVWYQLEELYPGTTTFILNNLSSRRVPAHALGDVVREIAASATEDPQVRRLFDSIATTEPMISATEIEPGPPVIPTSPLRPGRLQLFNGTPLLDVEGEPISQADRIADFDYVFEAIALTTPAARRQIRSEPPSVREVDLWKLYFEFRPRILKARDNLDYFLVLREFLARFKDRSIALRQTPALPVTPGSAMWSSVVGVAFARAGERVYVAKVTPGTAPAAAGVLPGLEVVSVDGRPAVTVHDLLTRFVETFDSSPSRQRAAAFALDLLLAGSKGAECALELRDPADPDGGGRVLRLQRNLPPPPKPVPAGVEHQLRAADQVGVIQVRQFAGDSLQRFAAALAELGKLGAKGLVIDVRGNEGLRDPRMGAPASLAVLSRLLPPDAGKLVVGSSVRRDKSGFDVVQSKEIVVAPTPGAAGFRGPIAVVTDAWTGGEAEVFVAGFQLAKLGLVVGMPTAGSVTMPTNPEPWQSLTRSRLDLSFGFDVVVRPNDDSIQTIGIMPQTIVEADPADLKSGRDSVLERAAALLIAR